MRIYLSGTTCPAVVALLPWATWNHFGLFQVFLNIFHSANWNIFSLFFVRHFLNVICTSGSLWRQGQTITTGFTLVTALNRTCCHLGRNRWEMEREACGQRGVKVAKNLCRLQGIQAESRVLLCRQEVALHYAAGWAPFVALFGVLPHPGSHKVLTASQFVQQFECF